MRARSLGDDCWNDRAAKVSIRPAISFRAFQGFVQMTISMYTASVPAFVQFLTSLSAVLDKAAAFAETKKIEPSVLLNTRLAPDMFPLVRQVRAATDHAINAGGRLSGTAPPTFSNSETSIPELKERIAKTVEFLKSLGPARIDGTEDKEIKITLPSGAVREFLIARRVHPGGRSARGPTRSTRGGGRGRGRVDGRRAGEPRRPAGDQSRALSPARLQGAMPCSCHVHVLVHVLVRSLHCRPTGTHSRPTSSHSSSRSWRTDSTPRSGS